jgi:osmotically inducible protein OsmC
MLMLVCAFTGHATARGGRSGKVVLGERGETALLTAMPIALGGAEGKGGTNPEELVGAAIAAAFYGSILHMARDRGLKGWDRDASVAAEVDILFPGDRSYYRIGVKLHVSLPRVEVDLARALIHDAKEGNGYWNALEESGVPLAMTLNGVPIA